MAVYGKIYTRLWNNHRFRKLTEDGQKLYLYLLSSPHKNTIGFYQIGIPYIQDDLGWAYKRCSNAINDTIRMGFIKYDFESRVVLILDWWKNNKPSNNKNLQKKMVGDLSEVGESILWQDFSNTVPTVLATPFEQCTQHRSNHVDVDVDVDVPVNVDVNVKVKEEGRAKSSTNLPQTNTNTIPFEEILNDLNLTAGTNFKPTAQTHQTLIKARWNEGYRLDDFKHVHRVKAFEWLNDQKMATFLRPKTLYCKSNFSDYLGQRLSADLQFSKRDLHNKLAGDQWLEEMQAKDKEVTNETK